ncbi:MAG: Holliday junction resolvase RuvX [Candidatus Gracilibacteria bacterium]|nr:Holliday junction resolvase RuvX [Candidatus Gracilibacteria bacterium]
MTALAIDLGDKRCGIAIELESIAIPKDIVLRQDIIKVINKYLSEYSYIDTIVVGLPYDLYGKELKQLEKTKAFIKQLEKEYKSLKIIGVDERFTTFEAENISSLLGGQVKRDDISASLILEAYLKSK